MRQRTFDLAIILLLSVVMCVNACRRLTGFFLGGHDRDLYIKCTSSEFANLPMIDVMQGGCIMTCSHFEKAAGRELSKKCVLSIGLSAISALIAIYYRAPHKSACSRVLHLLTSMTSCLLGCRLRACAIALYFVMFCPSCCH